MATKGKLKTILSDKAEDALATVIFLVFWPLIFLVLPKENAVFGQCEFRPA